MDPTDDPVPFNPLHLRESYTAISLRDTPPSEGQAQSNSSSVGGSSPGGNNAAQQPVGVQLPRSYLIHTNRYSIDSDSDGSNRGDEGDPLISSSGYDCDDNDDGGDGEGLPLISSSGYDADEESSSETPVSATDQVGPTSEQENSHLQRPFAPVIQPEQPVSVRPQLCLLEYLDRVAEAAQFIYDAARTLWDRLRGPRNAEPDLELGEFQPPDLATTAGGDAGVSGGSPGGDHGQQECGSPGWHPNSCAGGYSGVSGGSVERVRWPFIGYDGADDGAEYVAEAAAEDGAYDGDDEEDGDSDDDVGYSPQLQTPTPSTDSEMSAPRSDRNVHQDYIVRQRYQNSLPPPPGAPKLLDIPIDAINQYTSPVYASRMARSQPVNIEADAFLGMPIDLVGMPGVFEGDESAIQAPMVTPPVHPKDKALLRPLKSLGKPKGEEEDISFLRRTQYTAEERNRIDAARASVTPNIKKKRPDADKENPMNIKRSIIKGFDIANPQSAYKGPDTADQIRGHAPTAAELEAWNNPKHPTNPNAHPVDFYPVFPAAAMQSMPDDGAFVLIQLKGQPTEVTDKYDTRMDAALLRPDLDNIPELSDEVQAKMAAHKADPVHNEHPLLPYNYTMFLPEDAESAENFKQKFDPKNPDREDPALYTAKSDDAVAENDCFRYNYVREYETNHIVDNRKNPYQEVVMAIHDGDAQRGIQKGAYIYPIEQRIQLKPKRKVAIQQMGTASQVDDPETRIDRVHVTVREPNEEEVEMRAAHRKKLEPEDASMA